MPVAQVDTVYRQGGCISGWLAGELMEADEDLNHDLATGYAVGAAKALEALPIANELKGPVLSGVAIWTLGDSPTAGAQQAPTGRRKARR